MAHAKLSNKQQEILAYIKEQILDKGYPPTVREIGKAVKLKSSSSVQSHLDTLEKAGYIRRTSSLPRAIEVCDDSFQKVRTEMVNLPIVENLSDDKPVLAEENITGHFPVPSAYIPQGEPSFVMRLHGNFMIDAGILDGDYVIAQCCNEAKNGDIVIALARDSAMLATFCQEEGSIYIRPANTTMEPIGDENFRIWGRVFAIFRVFI